MAGAHPADIGVFVGTDNAPEGPAALLALDEGGKEELVALPLLVDLKGLSPGLHNLLGLAEGVGINDLQVGAVHHHPLALVPVGPPSGEEVGDLLLAVDDFAGVERVGEDAADCILGPLTAPLGFAPPVVEHGGDFGYAVSLLDVPLVHLADDDRFLLVDGEVEIVPDDLVVAVDDVGHSPLFGVHLLAELDPLGGVGALLLGQGAEDGEHKFAVAHAGHVGGEKLGLDAQGFELADALEQVHRVAGKAGDVLYHHHVEKAVLGVGQHAEELPAVFDFGARDALVRVEADQIVPGALGVLGEKLFLGLQTVELIGLVGRDPAVSGDIHSCNLPSSVCIVR